MHTRRQEHKRRDEKSGIKDEGGKRRETKDDDRGETEVSTEESERGIPKDEGTKDERQDENKEETMEDWQDWYRQGEETGDEGRYREQPRSIKGRIENEREPKTK